MSLYRFSTYTYGKTVSEEKETLKIEMRNMSTGDKERRKEMTATRRTEIGQGSASFGIITSIVARRRRQVSLTIASVAITRNRFAE